MGGPLRAILAVFIGVAAGVSGAGIARSGGRHRQRATGGVMRLPAPGHQPPPTGCREAESIAARDRYARVIYGDDRERDRWDNRAWDRDDERRGRGNDRDRPRAIPRRTPSGTYPYPDRYPNSRGRYGYENVPFDNGYQDYDKGLEDARDNDRFDPTRHGRYRSGDRGYDRRYGSKEAYTSVYREGFRSGYEEAYRDGHAYDPDGRRSGIRWPWPF